ncbi:MAG: hypothetical protein AAF789_07145, partial [Bacteroidota bacterium]
MKGILSQIAIWIISSQLFAQLQEVKTYYAADSLQVREIYYFDQLDSSLNGTYESFYSNGSLKTFGRYQQNLPDSSWQYYYENGRKKAEGNFQNGIKNGLWKFYFENG